MKVIKHFALPLFLTVSVFYMEMLLRLGLRRFPWHSYVLILLLSGMFALGIFLLGSLFSQKWRPWFYRAILLLSAGYFISQFIYLQIFQTFYTVYSALHGTGALGFQSIIYNAVMEDPLHILLFFLPMLFFELIRAHFPLWQWTLRKRVLTLLAGFILLIGAFGASVLGSEDKPSAHAMMLRRMQIDESVYQIGLMMTTWVDIKGHFIEAPSVESELLPQVDTVVPQVFVEEPKEEKEKVRKGEDIPTLREVYSVAYKANILPIDFKKLYEEEEDPILREMHAYFGAKAPSSKNDYTGRFAGDNLIFITAESLSHLAIDPVLTPTLYHLSTQGFVFENFYNPIWEVSTSDGEYVAVTGLLPKAGVWSLRRSADNYLPYSMGNALKKEGYLTKAYHNHYYDYYQRDKSHPNLGYDYKGRGNGLEITDQWPGSDLEMMQVSIDEYIDQEPFHAYYMTVSGHLLYSFEGNQMSAKNREYVKDLPYNEETKAYLAANIEFDRAMEYLLNRLREEGVAERTLIVISPDHYPYGLSRESIDELSGEKVEGNFELYRSTLMIYKDGMKSETITRPVSSLDIIPTLHNLMGLEYDSRLLMGTDAFSTNAPLVTFLNRSYISRDYRYNTIEGAFAGDVPSQWFHESTQQKIDEMFLFSSLMLEKDYYGLLKEAGQIE